jgi:HTH-type transcriptional regulator/antitoxin HigA
MNVRPIRTEADYEAALADIEPFFENEPELGSAEADRFDVLAALIADYERKHWRVEAPDAVTAILEVMAQQGYQQRDLAEVIGSRSRASEILRRKRRLTMDQARTLHERWHIPAESLLAG